MVRQLRAPRWPVVWNVVSPQVQLVADALLGKQAGETPTALQYPRGVLPLPLPADDQDADPAAQPLQVVVLHVREIVHRAVEVRGVAALTPAVPCGRVVVARQAECEREHVGSLEREVHRVIGAEADARGCDLLRPA